MKKLLPLLLLTGMAVATFFYLKTRDDPASGRSSLHQDISPSSANTRKDDSIISLNDSNENLSKPIDKWSGDNKDRPTQEQMHVESLAEFKKKRANNVVSQLQNELNEILISQGFNQNEIDIAAQKISNAFLNPDDDTIKLTVAIDEITSTLNLSEDRKIKLSNAVMSAVGSATSSFTHTEFQSCINLRTASASKCVKDLAQDLSQKVAAASESDLLESQTISALSQDGIEAVKKAIELCKEDPERANSYFKVNLSGCL